MRGCFDFTAFTVDGEDGASITFLDSALIPLAEQWKPPLTFLNDAD